MYDITVRRDGQDMTVTCTPDVVVPTIMLYLNNGWVLMFVGDFGTTPYDRAGS